MTTETKEQKDRRAQEMGSAVKVFEEIEKIRRGFNAKLTHLSKNRRCLDCGVDWMPKKFEFCPKCNSPKTKLMKKNRKCSECENVWEPSEMGVCPKCFSDRSEENPKDDPYIKDVIIPSLLASEDRFEADVIKKVGGEKSKKIAPHPAWIFPEQIMGAGHTSIGRIIPKIDITRLETVSAMWAHCGLGLNADGKPQRKIKGQTLNYNAQLQSNCIMLGQALMMAQGAYYDFYLEQKATHSGLPPAHCHNRAYRHMVKLFLSHFWEVWRLEEGLAAPPPYAFDILKHPAGHLITPSEMIGRDQIKRAQIMEERARKRADNKLLKNAK